MAEKEEKAVPKKRCWLYSPDCPAGKVFVGDDAIAAATKDGWVDSPDKVTEKASNSKSGGKSKATNDDDSK